ncbi:MAG: SpoIID/LytB domain-containing protein [Pseudomonadota bacterium]
MHLSSWFFRTFAFVPLLGLALFSCVKERPTLVYQSAVLGDGGRIARNLYRSYWVPPASDSDLVSVAIVPSRPKVEFRALHRMRIRAWSENASWEVASPPEVVWRVTGLGVTRPAILSYYASVDQRLVPRTGQKPVGPLLKWRTRGFKAARWIGPPAMDTQAPYATLERWILSLTAPASERGAQAVCDEANALFKAACDVASRVDLPPLGRGRLEAENGTFSKEFEGLLEILSPHGPVAVQGAATEEVRGDTSNEQYGPRLFLVPNPAGELSLVQQTAFRDYLEGVVPAELFALAPAEALKAQAVVARTFAARFNGASRLTGHPLSETPFFICSTTACQVYRGVTLKRPSSSAAVADTKDLVLRDATGDLAETFYHSTCGGHTEPRTNVMGSRSRPYLFGVSDLLPDTAALPLSTDLEVQAFLAAPPASYCGAATVAHPERWRWESRLGVSDIERVLDSLSLKPPLLDVSPGKRGASGRILEISFTTPAGKKRVVGELKIRKLLGGLPSSLFVFEAERDGGRIAGLKIHGAGRGHGVGLCQLGAVGRAERGQSYAEILAAYYPGTSLAPLFVPAESPSALAPQRRNP